MAFIVCNKVYNLGRFASIKFQYTLTFFPFWELDLTLDRQMLQEIVSKKL